MKRAKYDEMGDVTNVTSLNRTAPNKNQIELDGLTKSEKSRTGLNRMDYQPMRTGMALYANRTEVNRIISKRNRIEPHVRRTA